MTAEFAENPVTLNQTKPISVLFRGSSPTSPTTVSRLRATCGDTAHEVSLVVDLTEGQLHFVPETLAMAPGETALVRIQWDMPAGAGRARPPSARPRPGAR